MMIQLRNEEESESPDQWLNLRGVPVSVRGVSDEKVSMAAKLAFIPAVYHPDPMVSPYSDSTDRKNWIR